MEPVGGQYIGVICLSLSQLLLMFSNRTVHFKLGNIDIEPNSPSFLLCKQYQSVLKAEVWHSIISPLKLYVGPKELTY